MSKILFLHGAIGNSSQLTKISSQFEDALTYDFPGHGQSKDVAEFSIPLFAESVIAFLDKNEIQKIAIFGYSMGGYVGLYLAKKHPKRIEKVFCHGTKILWNEESARKETRLLNPKIIEEKVPQFANHLASIHGGKWKDVLLKTAKMLTDMGTNPPLDATDLQLLTCPVMISLGDKDFTADVNESAMCYTLLQNGFFSVLPNTPHPLEKTNSERLIELASDFFG